MTWKNETTIISPSCLFKPVGDLWPYAICKWSPPKQTGSTEPLLRQTLSFASDQIRFLRADITNVTAGAAAFRRRNREPETSLRLPADSFSQRLSTAPCSLLCRCTPYADALRSLDLMSSLWHFEIQSVSIERPPLPPNVVWIRSIWICQKKIK